MLLTLSLFQKWLGSPFPEDVWAWWLLMHWLQLQSTPCEALPSVWISFAWLYSQACGHPCCLSTFFYPNSSFQSTLHLICFDTALCKQPHLSVMTFCDLPSLWRASMFVFWIIAKSAVFPIIVVSKNKRYPEFKSESDVTYNQVWWPILGICALHLPIQSAHTQQWTHTRSSGQPFMLRRPGSSWGFGALLKGTSVVVLKVERALYIHSPHLQFLPARDSNPQPFDYKSESLTIRPRLPLPVSMDDGYCMDGHLLKLKCKYSNILRYWFWLSWAVMNLKYMKVSLFEISYKKKWTFSRHSNLLRCTCIYLVYTGISYAVLRSHSCAESTHSHSNLYK